MIFLSSRQAGRPWDGIDQLPGRPSIDGLGRLVTPVCICSPLCSQQQLQLQQQQEKQQQLQQGQVCSLVLCFSPCPS
jgi:hypothetical protein